MDRFQSSASYSAQRTVHVTRSMTWVFRYSRGCPRFTPSNNRDGLFASQFLRDLQHTIEDQRLTAVEQTKHGNTERHFIAALSQNCFIEAKETHPQKADFKYFQDGSFSYTLLALFVTPVSAQFEGLTVIIDFILAIIGPLLAPFFSSAIASTCDTAESLFLEDVVDCNCGGGLTSQGLQVDISCAMSERKSIFILPPPGHAHCVC